MPKPHSDPVAELEKNDYHADHLASDSVSIFKCPSCNATLSLNSIEPNKTFGCASKHSFDMAKDGYLNLLLAQHRRSRKPGDSDEMIRSRQRFLNAGYYQPLADTVVSQVLQTGDDQQVLDMGCGEGYYLQQLRQASSKLALCGIDISKTAVRLTAKRKMGAQLAVDSTFNLPLHSDSIDTAISVFSPISVTETARVLRSGGQLIMVGPGARHLAGLTAQIYSQNIPHRGNNIDNNLELFKLKDQLEIADTISVEGTDILDLLKMTPYYWHARAEQQSQMKELKMLQTEIHFTIKTYQLA
ncbi:methyltransferase domain-containing protein [SAR92 clade bacterium H921]|nr:methyltransferase domain-containing protein [SAR92 clade bacterium H921]